ncbi:MAG: hypothetical protein ACKOW9_01365 [Candidatus Paceibacterota bacterium]
MHQTCSECGSIESLHPQKHISYKNKATCVDEAIAELILSLWERGIRTAGSCQGKQCPPTCIDPYCRTDYAYIIFRNADNMENFLELIEQLGIKKDYLLRKHSSDSNYHFTVVNSFEDLHSNRIKKRLSWRWEMLDKPSNAHISYPIEQSEKTSDEFVNTHRWELRFPIVDLKPLTHLLKKSPVKVKSLIQTLPNSEKYYGAIHIDKGVITGFGAYLKVNTFDPEPLIQGFENIARSGDEYGLTLEEFVNFAKQDFHDHLERVITGESDATSLLRDIRKSKVFLQVEEDAYSLHSLAELPYEY